MADDTSINEKIDILDQNLDTAEPEKAVDEQAKPVTSAEVSEASAPKAEADSATDAAEKEKPPAAEPEYLVVEGFEFLSKEDAEKAKLDKQKIDILGQKVKSTRVADLEAVYEKSISTKIFSTPVGWFYLARLRDRLIKAGVQEDDLTPIPIELKITRVDLKDEYHPRQFITPVKKKRDKKTTMVLLGAMNVILVILVIAMFMVAYYSETDNIINYKQNVTNRYAEWEQSLKDREKAVRIKERDLQIEDETGYATEFGVDPDANDEGE